MTHKDSNFNQSNDENLKLYKLPLSKYEITVIIFGTITLIILMISLISSKITLENDNQSFQQIDNKIVKVHNNNSNLKQEISELQNDNRLQKIAKKYGLKLNNKNVRNVNR